MSTFFFKKANNYIYTKELLTACNLLHQKIINKKIFGVNNIKDAKNNEISFFNNPNYITEARASKAMMCFVNDKLVKYLNKKTIPIISKKPLVDFYKIVSFFYPESTVDNEKVNFLRNKKIYHKKNIFVGENTLIDQTVNIGRNTKIGNNVVIKSNVQIGKNCIIGSNVIIENSLLGDNVIIKSNSTIGQTGFGFNFENKKRIKFPHIGRVIIENDVLIGSFCSIDRGSLSDTVIGEFTSIDNQVQIAHNVKIGNYCMIAAQVGIAGSTVIGNNVKVGGQAGISGHLKIGNNVKIGGKSGVISNIEDNQSVMGYPAQSIRNFIKNIKK
jgi:UDP-3-O-[3-hydroxymyristoyl] glucosamine N-acyltransferase